VTNGPFQSHKHTLVMMINLNIPKVLGLNTVLWHKADFVLAAIDIRW
jgi:hypothetical protein